MVQLSLVDLEFIKRRSPMKMEVAAAVDGSVMSDKAFELATKFVDQKQRKDGLAIAHVADPSKTYLPRHLLPSHMKHVYMTKAMDFRVNAEWACVDKDAGESTCQALMDIAKDRNTDLLVLGSFGRKGEKLDMLGSVSDFSLRQADCSVCVVRSTSRSAQQGSTILFTTDGSHASAVGICVLVHLLYKPLDTVIICCVAQNDTEYKAHMKECDEMLKQYKVTGRTLFHMLGPNQTVADGILDVATTLDVDLLVVSIAGYKVNKLGSVSEEIILRARCNTLVLKDSYEDDRMQIMKGGMQTVSDHILGATDGRRSSMPENRRVSASGGSVPAGNANKRICGK